MSALTPERLTELRRIAEAATPGPWTADAGFIVVLGSDGWAEKSVACLDIDGNPMDDEYIAAFDPPTVLALLDEVEQLITKCEELTEALESAVAWLREPYLMRYPDDAALARQLEDALRVSGGGNGE